MKGRLILKFIAAYAVLALLSVFVAATLGAELIGDRLVTDTAYDLYREASRLAENGRSAFTAGEDGLAERREALSVIALSQGADIRFIRPDGTVVLDTTQDDTWQIEGFDYAAFGPKYYEVSTFFGVYSTSRLTVMVPSASGLSTSGYVAVSVSMQRIEEETASLTRILYIIVAVNLGLALFLLLMAALLIYRPLREITDGARAFASGDLSHKIEVSSKDEMGNLADTMNYMALQLQKNSEYQKKFISNISHDFRSPLTSIKGFTEAMMDGTIPPELHEKYLRTISGEADRLVKLTREILTLNSVDSDRMVLNLEDFDINAVLKNTAAVFEGSCRKKKITISLVLAGESLSVNADKERIEQVIYNLLDNAIKFSDKNSEITLETTEKHGKCYVSVRDEGCGIPRESLPRIWDRFYKEDTSRGLDRTGTGLGLSIAREIITAHGQNINVISTENVGTEFYFSLALAK